MHIFKSDILLQADTIFDEFKTEFQSLKNILFSLDEEITFELNKAKKQVIFSYNKRRLAVIALKKRYISLYLGYPTPSIPVKYHQSLKSLSYGKGCIRFSPLTHIPAELIRKILNEQLEKIIRLTGKSK
jgi:uncharacterized protein YdhG (YjbR/CyaY superfamily)